MPKFHHTDVRSAEHKKQMSEVKRIKKLERKIGKKNAPKGKPKKGKSGKQKGPVTHGKSKGQMSYKGSVEPLEEALPKITSSSDGKFAVSMQKVINPGVPPLATPPTTFPNLNDGFSNRLAQLAQPWRRHSPRWLEVELQSRAGGFVNGLMGISYVSSCKTLPPTTLEAAKMMPHVCVKVSQSTKFKLPIKRLESGKNQNLLVRRTTPAGVEVDGTSDLKTTFDWDTYDNGYFVVWSDGCTKADGTAAAIPVADVWIRGSWFLTERVDVAAPSVSFSTGPLMDQYKVTKAYTSTATGDQTISDVEILPSAVWPQQAASNLGSSISNVSAGTWEITFPVVGAYMIALQLSAREVDPGYLFYFHESNTDVNLEDHLTDPLSLLYDISTGDTYRTATCFDTGNAPLCGSIARFAFIECKDVADKARISMQHATSTINRSAPPSGVGQLGFGWDLYVSLIPTAFIPSAVSDKQKLLLLEQKVNNMVALEKKIDLMSAAGERDRKREFDRVIQPSNRSQSETRKERLKLAIAGELSPTPSIIDDLKKNYVKVDQKDEKTAKK